MSHNVLIQNVKITSLDALRRAITELNAEGVRVSLLKQDTFRTYPGQSNRCDYCLSTPDIRFDVGLRLQPDGSYVPICDASMMPKNGEGISCQIGPGAGRDAWDRAAIGKLMQRYSVCVAEDTLQSQGHLTNREVTDEGDILLTAEYV